MYWKEFVPFLPRMEHSRIPVKPDYLANFDRIMMD